MTSRDILRVMKLSSNAILPSKGSALAAGFDLSSAYDVVIPARGKGLVKTDLVIGIPPGCYARVAPRSGLALKKFIDSGAGVIDADYRGNVGVVLFNHSSEDFEVKHGDRVAQLILEKIAYADLEEVTEIEDTERGAGGFGSTGINHSLKRSRASEEEAAQPAGDSFATSTDVIYRALQKLCDQQLVDEPKRKQVIKALFSAQPSQLDLLQSAMKDYVDGSEKVADERALEWLDGFLEVASKNSP